jgi:hypothetical protein
VGASLAAKKKAELVEAKERTTDGILYYSFIFKAVRFSIILSLDCLEDCRNRECSDSHSFGREKESRPSERCTSSA